MLTVITRTSNRPNAFERCRESVLKQTVQPKHVVICDTDEDYPEGDVIVRLERQEPKGKWHAPWNLYFNHVVEHIEDYVMFLDDDDMYWRDESVEIIRTYLNYNHITMWQVQKGKDIFPSNWEDISFGNVCGMGFAYHKDHWVDWGEKKGGDWRVVKELREKLETLIIPRTLTGSTERQGEGKREDITKC